MISRVREIINEMIQFLNEFAFDRKKAIYQISGLCIPFTEHIVKLSIYGNNLQYYNDVNKWKDEIYNYILKASLYYSLKGNSNLKPKDYLDNFFFGLMETKEELIINFNKLLNNLNRLGFKKVSKINYDNIYNKLNIFVDKVISKFPNVDYDDIIKLLDDYIIGSGVE